MLRELQRRLRRLECNRPQQQTEEEKVSNALFKFIMTAVGYYLGDPRPEEAPSAACARALGYAHEGELQNAIKGAASEGSNPELSERLARARSKLFAKFGFNLDEANMGDDAVWYRFTEILKRIHAGMSGRHKELAQSFLRFD